MTDATKITEQSRPVLPKGVRLTDNPQQGTVLVAPERVFKADGVAAAILKKCDGKATVAEIADGFAAAYNAPRDRILKDVLTLLQSLADKRLLETSDEH